MSETETREDMSLPYGDDTRETENVILELLCEAEIAAENMDEKYVGELTAKAEKLIKGLPFDFDTAYMLEQIKRYRRDIAVQKRFNETKRVMKESYISYGMSAEFAEEFADDFAWQERYDEYGE